ncbi:MAG: tail assembly protein, partial [Rhodanobacter sp.]
MNSPTFTTIRLYGPMGVRFGRSHRFALDTHSPAEAVQALMSQHKGFREYLMGAKDKGIGFAVFNGKRNLTEDQLNQPTGSEEIRIAPVLTGSKNGGVFSIILGAVLIAAGAYINFISEGGASALGNALIGAGISMVVGGVVQLLSPHPKGLASKDSAANTPGYAF